MRYRSLRLVAYALAATFSGAAFGQTPQIFGVCGSQPNLPTVYFSGVLQGPAAGFAAFRTGFAAFLAQRYGYKGAVACAPANTAANAQTFMTARSTALRNGKHSVIQTGWSEAAPAAAPFAAPLTSRAQGAAPQAAAASTAAGGAPAGGATNPASQLTNILGSVFSGGGGSAGSAGSSKSAAASKSAGASGAGASAGGAASTSPFQQVSTALTSVFGNKSGGGGASGQGSAPKSQPNAADGALGSAQTQTSKLVVYGCGRQDTQVACVTELTNQNQKDTLVQASDAWKQAFIVDDRGDRHRRTSGFFLNVDGDQRSQLDISYGKAARFILMFDGVQTKVQKVALRSTEGGLDVEEISLVAPNAGTQANQQR